MSGGSGTGMTALPRGACLGCVGGGQLGRYFVLEARRLGFATVVLDPDLQAPAMQLGDTIIVAAYDDPQALDRLASLCDAVTLEFENVPAAALESLSRRVRVAPRSDHVAIAQDRRLEKRLARDHGLATAEWTSIEDEATARGVDTARLPGILKTARLGYDGKGQAVCHTPGEVLDAWQRFGGVACVLERRLALRAELSVVVVRGDDGQSVAYPPAENVHRDGILHTSTVPCTLPQSLLDEAMASSRALADALDYIGVLAIEYFIVADADDNPSLVFNELAPRPHNSGHWTLDASETSQFEQQARALAGWPLGGVGLLTPVSMLNLLGDDSLDARVKATVARSGASLHLYGKRIARPGRKMGHVNCLSSDSASALAIANELHVSAG